MFKVGNIVKLKSGGPAMTVQKTDGGKTSCIWFKDDRLKTAIFRKDTIELISPIIHVDNGISFIDKSNTGMDQKPKIRKQQ